MMMTTILLIEDNDVIRENTAEILALTGYTVHTAQNGKVGVERALAHRPDLVICDIMMPVLDGYGVLHIFNKNPLLSGIPFIFLSAKIERSDFRKGMDLGADDYLTKPFEESELLSAIEGRLNRVKHVEPVPPELVIQSRSACNLQQDGLGQFLDDALRGGNGLNLSADRKAYPVRKRQFVYSEGDEPIRLYFLKSGTVKTTRVTADGKELITGLYQAGDFFGHFALLDNQPYTDSALTVADAELIYIPKDDFCQLLLVNPAVSSQFIKLLAGQVADRETQLLGMAYNSLRRRVADTLLRLHESHPDEPVQLSRDDLAAMTGTATESLIRTLTEFKRADFIGITATGGILVVQPDKLRRGNW